MFASFGCSLAVFAASFSVYLLTLCPTVYVEGSGELIGAVYFLGTPHPTGYPLFCLIGRLFAAFLPLDSPAVRVNVATAFTSSLAAAVLAAFLRSRGVNPWSALAGGLFLAFSRTFWSQAVIAEVYGLSLSMAVGAMGVGVLAAERRDWRLLWFTGFLMGLGLTAHLNQALVWPGLVFLWLWRWPGFWHQGRRLVGFLLAFLGGYSLVFYLLLRNGRGPGFHWGLIDEPGLLWDHLTGALYRSSFFSLPWQGMLDQGWRWLGWVGREFTPLLVPLVLWGVGCAWRQDRNGFAAVGGAILANLGVALNYHRDPNGLGVFFLLSFAGLAILLGYAVDDLGQRLGKSGRILAAALTSMALMVDHWTAADRSGNWIAHQYGLDILEGLPQEAVLVTEGDDAAFILDYLQRVEGRRPDVALFNRMGRGTDLLQPAERKLPPPALAQRRREREAALIQQGDRPVFFLVARGMPLAGYQFLPAGLVYRVAPQGEKPQEIPLSLENAQREDLYRDPWVRKIQANYWYMLGEQKQALGRREEAISAYERAAALAFDSRTLRFNVALALYRCGELNRAWEHAQASRELDPWQSAPHRLLAQIARQQGQVREAEELFRRARALEGSP